ncbi:hypothetical protein IEQ34_017148 [Dendrobium chrysotoxum]|uniref:BZIP domain-containing protein n=1 Tax=Dendrobium chrysotoxum TaxID=161865 RepID=A0AAV7GAQ9_DENCH|nr:hypothetical protein IEQ34_017148 [Dendrobium chrysotoxum]
MEGRRIGAQRIRFEDHRMVGAEVCGNPNGVSNGKYALTSSSSRSSSSSSSSCLSLSPVSENGGECGLDGMELEAARALACIARTAVRECGGRRLKRFKNRSPVRDCENCNQDWNLDSVPEDNKTINATVEKKIKVEQISEILPPSSNCSTNSVSCSGRKTRLNLTEAEREARRMRRVLANRESARQTIRRRQALRDGLTKKVSDLSLDNQNMKMEKGQITKEYMLLRNKNKQLKNELAMAIACNIMSAESTSPPLETSSLPSENSFLANIKPPFIPVICPPWPVIAAHPGLCYDENGFHKATESQTTPCSCFCSLLDQMSVARHSISGKWKAKETDLVAGCSKATVVEEKPAIQEQNRRYNSATHALALLKDETMKVDKSHKLDIDLNSMSVMPEPSLDAEHSSVSDEPVQVVAEQSVKFVDASAASSARRRRKEILKLKHLCGSPIVLHI